MNKIIKSIHLHTCLLGGGEILEYLEEIQGNTMQTQPNLGIEPSGVVRRQHYLLEQPALLSTYYHFVTFVL